MQSTCVVKFNTLTLRRVVTLARSNLRAASGHAANFDANRAKAPVTSFIGRIVAETVLSADLVSDLRERCAGVVQIVGTESFAAGSLREFAHLAASQIIKAAANLHSFKLSHLAEIFVTARVCTRDEESAITLK